MRVLFMVLGGVGALCVLLSLLYLLVLVRPRGRRPADESLLCDYAHRGLHGNGVPENSLAAFELACRAGLGIELDVQLSADGEVMVFHDFILSRMTKDTRPLARLTASELRELRLGESEEVIPTFAEVLALVDGRVPLLVELKGEDLNAALCPKAAALLEEYRGSYCIESFNPLLLRGMRKCLPGAYYGLLYTNVVREKKRAAPLHLLLTAMAFNFLCRPDFIAYNEVDRRALPVRLATKMYRAEKFSWTVRSRSALKTAHDLGECAIFETLDRP